MVSSTSGFYTDLALRDIIYFTLKRVSGEKNEDFAFKGEAITKCANYYDYQFSQFSESMSEYSIYT